VARVSVFSAARYSTTCAGTSTAACSGVIASP
jgi:hypothetical protein